MSKRAYLGIGGNIGDRKANIEGAIEILRSSDSIEVTKVSSLYETEPVGYEDQDWFVNVVVEIKTTLSPYELLGYCQSIENELKRVRLIRWGPRTIDVDVLLYEGYESDAEDLTVPHPRMTERAFVMVPLYEINDDLQIAGKHISELMESLEGEEINKL
ncbi:2-amino-4-hydroxy-6-hydroxymethyldihydropteridine pyrophosphokinase [Andreesenia angusta]|uniref:2-amino-4-hydroxy-6-hydroxymethyldihydropteridine diphosphokinase n=1 Tax=Andreesenia angusta TaxID=39480 RepID=A0A1S1V658_9FIRM|nr:2-amino-4-hydroxy-6-hydroxymethyldihydropteridine diphosphokinase [Andreesenia angusta]OHW62088.1 2-amino-4-hydroxy-6-hydroxymethyldihydropteridine pyrophosphokinase [Andreesenia angusta]